MTINYYIKTYNLTESEAVKLRQTLDEEGPALEEALEHLASRWIQEIRPRYHRASQCRAIMFRFVMESLIDANPPDYDRLIAIVWANVLTDRIHQRVEEGDVSQIWN